MARPNLRRQAAEKLEVLRDGGYVPKRSDSRYSPRFVEIARILSAAGVNSENELAKRFGVSQSTISAWKKKIPEFAAAIEGGCLEMVEEMTSAAVRLARQGDAQMIRYLLDRRADGFKPKQALDHTSNGNTLKALLDEHGTMSDDEARDKGLIIEDDSED